MKTLKLTLFKPPEKELVQTILEWCRLRRIYAWRQSTTGIWNKEKHFYCKAPKRGASDIIGLFKLPSGIGVFVAIEAKIKGNRTKPEREAEQQQFRDDIRANGGIAFKAFSVEDCEREFQTQLRELSKTA